MDRLFPLGQSAADTLADETGDDDDDDSKIEARLLKVQEQATWVQPQPIDGDNIRRPGSLHQRYETVDDLSGPAKAFHERAAKLSGLPTVNLLRAVFKLEQLLIYWTDHLKKGAAEQLDREVEGVQSRSLARILGVKQI